MAKVTKRLTAHMRLKDHSKQGRRQRQRKATKNDGDGKYKLKVIGHRAVGVDLKASLLAGLAQGFRKTAAVIVLENVLVAVAPTHSGRRWRPGIGPAACAACRN